MIVQFGCLAVLKEEGDSFLRLPLGLGGQSFISLEIGLLELNPHDGGF